MFIYKSCSKNAIFQLHDWCLGLIESQIPTSIWD